jgi:diguanylate cyclase (GGDEF)-like protein
MDIAVGAEPASGKQQVRIRRFYLASAAYAACLVVLAAANRVGLMGAAPMLRIALLMIAANAVFFAMFRTGWNQRFPDPSLTWPQVVAAMAIVMYAVYYFDTERGLALMMCLVVLPFGAFRFTTRDFLVATGLVLAGYLLVINVMMWAKPSVVNVPIEAYRWLTMALVLPCFSLVAGRISELRRRLRRTNDELSSALAMIQKMATHDALTGLPNRALFNEALVHAIGQAQRHRRSLALFFLDMDRFKNINDTLGHTVGDRVLLEVGRRLTAAVRASDMVARLGGDEFVLLVEDFADTRDLADIAGKILGAFEPTFTVEAQELALSASIGICTFPEDGRDAQTLLSNADIAMYRAKEQGRNRHCFYSAELNKLSQERLALEAALKHAVERDEIEIYYQPKIEFGGGRVTGVEALIRWRHAQLGLLLPDRFVPLAEETGLIVPIGYWTLRKVCERLRRWREQGLALSIAVNLSASQFHQPELVKELAAILWSTGAPAQHLELEITETMVMRDPDRAVAVMEQLRAMGVRLSIDDFGTGHSSLGYLKRFPIDRLKVDRSFVRELPHNGDDAAITRAVIALAHSLKMTVVAEGVEDEQQFELLREQGCDEFQGYFCRPPLPEAELLRFLAEERGSFNRARPLDSRVAS